RHLPRPVRRPRGRVAPVRGRARTRPGRRPHRRGVVLARRSLVRPPRRGRRVTPQHITTGPGAHLPGPAAAAFLVAVTILTAGAPLGMWAPRPPPPPAHRSRARRDRAPPDRPPLRPPRESRRRPRRPT